MKKICGLSILSFLLACFQVITLSAQSLQDALDSLNVIVQTAHSDSLRVEALLSIGEIRIYEDTDSAEFTFRKAMDLAEKIGNEELLIRCLQETGQFYFRSAQFDKCIEWYERALRLAEDGQNEQAIYGSYNWMGNAWQRKGDYGKAEEFHQKNIRLSLDNNDQEGIASSYNNLGNLFNEKGDYANAVEYYTRALIKYEGLQDELSAAIVQANIGMIHNRLEKYDEAIRNLMESNAIFSKLHHQMGINFVLKTLGISYKSKGDLEQAMSIYREALKNYQAMNAQFELAELSQNIGNIYWETRKYDSARIHYLEALKYSLAIQDSTGIGRAYSSIGSSYHVLGKLTTAVSYLEKARSIGHQIGNPEIVRGADQELSLIYAATGTFDKAYKSLKNYTYLNDSLHGVEKLRVAEEIEAKYQNEKKQKEITLLHAQNELNTLQITKRENERNYLLILTIAALLIVFILYRQYRIKKASSDKLRELNRLQSSFFTNISHEFRTPLTLIRSSLDRIKTKNPQDSGDHVTIQRNSDRLLQLINQLLDLSRLDAGREKLAVRKLEVMSLLKGMASNFSSLAEARKVEFLIDIPGQEVIGHVDPDKVEKIVYNLLSNAFKFTPARGSIRISCIADNQQLTLRVEDSGKGIPEEAASRIFDRFYQVQDADSREFEGSGVGLSLIRELVTLHKGHIKVETAVKKGSCFIVTLPLKGYRKAEMEPGETGVEYLAGKIPEPALSATVPAKKTIRQSEENEFVILIAEDHPELLLHLSEALTGQYRVLTAINGSEGFDLAQTHIPDLVISDVMMPTTDGVKMCQLIKATEKTSHIPVILLTAKADQTSRLEGLKSGADDYLSKPFDQEELKLKIANLLHQRQRLQMHIKTNLLFPGPQLTSSEKFIKKASDLILDNLSNSGFTAEEFTRMIGYSRMQLHRKIKAITGKSTNEFILSIRLKKAALMLEKELDNVAQVAYATGFGSPSHFSRCFKKEFGVSPREYSQG